mmetsp:Transcript_5450/g.12346  ORF Transcript_5450/g.12346 Transcript_5450/m.12346 type:complete len:96 (+) Transcript_5450:1227-1514(+)
MPMVTAASPRSLACFTFAQIQLSSTTHYIAQILNSGPSLLPSLHIHMTCVCASECYLNEAEKGWGENAAESKWDGAPLNLQSTLHLHRDLPFLSL